MDESRPVAAAYEVVRGLLRFDVPAIQPQLLADDLAERVRDLAVPWHRCLPPVRRVAVYVVPPAVANKLAPELLQLADESAKDSEDDRVQVLIYRGLIFSETGKLSGASDQFKRALAIRPWAEVPEGTSPRIAKNFSDARKSLWGMASVKPPQKRVAAPAPDAQPAFDKK